MSNQDIINKLIKMFDSNYRLKMSANAMNELALIWVEKLQNININDFQEFCNKWIEDDTHKKYPEISDIAAFFKVKTGYITTSNHTDWYNKFNTEEKDAKGNKIDKYNILERIYSQCKVYDKSKCQNISCNCDKQKVSFMQYYTKYLNFNEIHEVNIERNKRGLELLRKVVFNPAVGEYVYVDNPAELHKILELQKNADTVNENNLNKIENIAKEGIKKIYKENKAFDYEKFKNLKTKDEHLYNEIEEPEADYE